MGSTRWMRELQLDLRTLEPQAAAQAELGRSVSWLVQTAPEVQVLALLSFADQVRPAAASAVAQLHGLGIHTVMLTGDNAGATNSVGQTLGIQSVLAEVRPEHKSQAVVDLQQAGHQVAMVGDGVNDARALAAADVGIAMGSGTDVAMQSAGITLMRGDPGLIADALQISRRTYSKIRQNLFWAFAFNTAGIPLAALGMLSPVVAGGAMALSSLFVIGNALLLGRWKRQAPLASTEAARGPAHHAPAAVIHGARR